MLVEESAQLRDVQIVLLVVAGTLKLVEECLRRREKRVDVGVVCSVEEEDGEGTRGYMVGYKSCTDVCGLEVTATWDAFCACLPRD